MGPALLLPLGVYSFIFVLHLVVPGRWVDGYVRDARGQPLRYRLNGLRVFFVVIATWALASWRGWIPWDLFWTYRWPMAIGACVIGLVFTFAIVLPAPPVKGIAADLYFGRLANPQWGGGRLDAKMFLYLVGAV